MLFHVNNFTHTQYKYISYIFNNSLGSAPAHIVTPIGRKVPKLSIEGDTGNLLPALGSQEEPLVQEAHHHGNTPQPYHTGKTEGREGGREEGRKGGREGGREIVCEGMSATDIAQSPFSLSRLAWPSRNIRYTLFSSLSRSISARPDRICMALDRQGQH